MAQNENENHLMMRISGFIVRKRNAFLILFLISCIYSMMSISRVEVIDSLTKYLPKTTETRQGVDIMEREFKTFGSARVLVSNISLEKSAKLAKELEAVKGISAVYFYDAEDDFYKNAKPEDYYREASALFMITFEEEEGSGGSEEAMLRIREILDDYDSYIYTTVDKDDSADLKEDMKVILAIVSLIIVGVLIFTSQTYMEILIFMVVFGAAAVLNIGTNFLFGSVSFVTNAVAVVLQLAMAIDYAIILFHRFMEEREDKDSVSAMTAALSKAIVEISSSSLTTISGMLALMLMQFGIGLDMGRVLTKAIILSMVSVFLLMPALVIVFDKMIEKTRHKSFVPKIDKWGSFVILSRKFTLPIFFVLILLASVFSGKSNFIYDVNSIDTQKKNEYLIAKEKIEEKFEVSNPAAIIVPKGDYKKEAMISYELEQIPQVQSVLSMSNIRLGENDEFSLVDEINTLDFSEIAKKDPDMIRLLYRFYAMDHNQYSALLKGIDSYKVPVIDMAEFVYEQKEKGGIELDEESRESIDEIHKSINTAREQLEGEEYSRIVFYLRGKVEGRESFDQIDRIREIVGKYYENDYYVVGDITANYDLSNSFKTDNKKISILTALFVGIILLFSFQSLSLPFILLFTIQGSIWFNFTLPYITGTDMFFLSYLIVSSIQMGCTIDYAIVITSRYLSLRKNGQDKKAVVVRALDESFPTILTSGSILACAGFVIGIMTKNATISSLGMTIGKGTLISIMMVMTLLPQILLVFDRLIERTDFTSVKERRFANQEEEKEDEKR